jgi:dienelactone hydrolase
MSRHRNLSAQKMFEQLAREHKPQCAFRGRNKRDFQSWKRKTRPLVNACLGDFPGKVRPNPEKLAEFEHDGVRKQRWLIDVGRHAAVVCQVNYPPDLKRGQKRPAIQCWHGHGDFGKESVMGNDSSPERSASIKSCNYNYGHQMAQAGFITYGIDWMGKGERLENDKPNFRAGGQGRDWCNIYYLHATMLGMTSISVNVAHGKAATDFVCKLPGVDGRRLGVMGLSGGGTMTVWSAFCDQRFKAAEIICYSDLWEYFGLRDTNYCGMQVAPGLYKLVDLPDLQGLLAPKPLLVDIGAYDACFRVDGALQCFKQVEKIYKAAAAREKLELDYFVGEHSWGGNKSVEFFAKHLNL